MKDKRRGHLSAASEVPPSPYLSCLTVSHFSLSLHSFLGVTTMVVKGYRPSLFTRALTAWAAEGASAVLWVAMYVHIHREHEPCTEVNMDLLQWHY